MILVSPETDCKNNGKNPGETGTLNTANLMITFIIQEASMLPKRWQNQRLFEVFTYSQTKLKSVSKELGLIRTADLLLQHLVLKQNQSTQLGRQWPPTEFAFGTSCQELLIPFTVTFASAISCCKLTSWPRKPLLTGAPWFGKQGCQLCRWQRGRQAHAGTLGMLCSPTGLPAWSWQCQGK